jgi:hypothetical protein
MMRNNLKIAVISVIGLLTLTVISAMTINGLPVAKAGCDGNCRDEAYGDLVSSEAQNPNNEPGYGDEVSPLARDSDGDGQNGMKEFRQSGVNARGGDSAPGNSGQEHGNDD